MDSNLERLIDLRVEKTIKALEKNNMKGYYVKSEAELLSLIDSLIKSDRLITAGGSVTLSETGVISHLKANYGNVFADRADCKSAEETEDVFRKAFISDTFFASTNAVTENGELYNIDGNGNRVSAMIFGPKQVIIVAGVNKIVDNMNEAVKRLEKTACPANTIRLEKATPCSKTGECVHCQCEDRICCSYVTLAHQRKKERIKVIFVKGSFGY